MSELVRKTILWQIGYEFFVTIPSIKLPLFNFLVSMSLLGCVATTMVEFLEEWYWEPLITMPFFIGAYVVDLYTAILLSGRLQGKALAFDTTKFQMFLAKFIAVLLLLGVLHAIPMLAKHMMEFQGSHPENVKMVHNALVGAVWLAFLSLFTTQLISALANGAKAGLWNKQWARWVASNIDTHKSSVFDKSDKQEMFDDKFN